jgi:ribulose-phosphate 3-epimerase
VARQPAGDTGTLQIAPSILSADFADLAAALREVDPEADRVHIDVMDGHFVPNLTVGPAVVASIRGCSERYFECHLMLTDPGEYLEPFAAAGADGCIVHVEVGRTAELIERAGALGLSIGLAVSPETPIEAAFEWLGRIDLVLVMTVHPGFGGQAFIPDTLPKIRAVRDMIDRLRPGIELEVDGGIDPATAPLAYQAGARVFVAGSSIFKVKEGVAAAMNQLRQVLES